MIEMMSASANIDAYSRYTDTYSVTLAGGKFLNTRNPACGSLTHHIGNLTLKARPDTPLTWRKDVKFGETFKLPDDPRRRGQFSVSDKTFASPFFHYFMETNFGKPCRFEKECA